MNKWIGISLGALVGVSHIGMIGFIATRNNNKLPALNIPVTPYSSYVASVSEDGYKISYSANDPKVMITTEDVVKPSGFLGLGKKTTQIVREYTMDGAEHHGGPVSSPTAWIDPSAQGAGQEPSDKTIACIKAIGSAEGTGRLVGTSVGAAAAPTVSSIPFVGWVVAGWVAMFGGEQGAEIGGNMAQDLNKNC
ncbi:uncharacterized protein METZ01_LOCUS145815 [marine metagenome]|uniref:Uncharacterized protein n=1 Tax=marine metagenome TaxID=408172 RepID=A0A381ZVF9_9ZZZZ